MHHVLLPSIHEGEDEQWHRNRDKVLVLPTSKAKAARLIATWRAVVLLIHRVQVLVFLAQRQEIEEGGEEGKGWREVPYFLTRREMGGSLWLEHVQRERMDGVRRRQAAARVVWGAWKRAERRRMDEEEEEEEGEEEEEEKEGGREGGRVPAVVGGKTSVWKK